MDNLMYRYIDILIFVCFLGTNGQKSKLKIFINQKYFSNEKQKCSSLRKKVKLSTLFDSDSESEEEPNKISKEIESYFSSVNYHVDDDPITWWKYNKNSFPNLFKLAIKYLCAQATSAPSERVFSKGG